MHQLRKQKGKVKLRQTAVGKPSCGDDGRNRAGKKFYAKLLDAIRGLTFEDKSWVSARRNYWSEEGGNQFEEEEMENQEIVGEEGEMEDVGALFGEGDEEGE